MAVSSCALLGLQGEYTTFSFRDTTLTFLTSKDLDRYLKILTWDHGYLVVLAKYKSRPVEEEYIDLTPILTNLYMDPDAFYHRLRRWRSVPEYRLQEIADRSAMIVGGYAFSKMDDMIRVLNLNNPSKAMVLSPAGVMLETNMDPIEQTLVLKHWERNSCFMEDTDA